MSGSRNFFMHAAALVLAALGVATAAPALGQGIESDLVQDGGRVYTDPYPDPEGAAVAPAPAAPASASATVAPTEQAEPSVQGNGMPVDGDLQGAQYGDATAATADASAAASAASADPAQASAEGNTYKQDDLIGAAEGVFGKGAEGLARMIETWLEKQGEPNAYIVGREGGGAIVFGLRYGSGTLYHKVEGERPVYWTGPSVGFDVGANAGNTFVLVYNLFDSEELYKRFPAGEGQAYVVGGLTASYLRKGDVVLIPIRMGAGLRLGVNAGYMKFSKKQRWIPF